jgi:hypothetical protein
VAIEGQRFCRSCGANLGAIVDVMEDRRAALDFESLKSDLRDLGVSLRAGFEGARSNIKPPWTSKLPSAANIRKQAVAVAPMPRGLATIVRQRREASTRKYSLQQATLSLLGGSATCGVLYYFLNHAVNSGFVTSVINSITALNPKIQLGGAEQIVSLLWVFGLIGIAKGAGHVINAIFFGPPKDVAALPLPEVVSAPPVVAPPIAPSMVSDPGRYVATPSSSPTTNELENAPQSSVTIVPHLMQGFAICFAGQPQLVGETDALLLLFQIKNYALAFRLDSLQCNP